WFHIVAGATGDLTISVAAPTGSSALHLELTNESGSTVLAVGSPIIDATGLVVRQQITLHNVNSGDKFLVHVSGAMVPLYSLVLQNLPKDLGTSVEGAVDGSITSGGQNFYRLATPVTGSLVLAITKGSGFTGTLTLQVLSADGQTVLASGSSINLAVQQ